MAVQGKIKVTYVDHPKCRFVCFNSDILAITKRFKINKAGMLVGNMFGWTVKDFRDVDKSIYFFPGKVSEEDVQTMIGMYNASLGKKGWVPTDLTFVGTRNEVKR